MYDFNGDGISEIVYRDESNLRILYGGGTPFPPGVDAERNWFKTTLACIGDAVIATDGGATISNMNVMAEKLTGWTEAEAKGGLARADAQ